MNPFNHNHIQFSERFLVIAVYSFSVACLLFLIFLFGSRLKKIAHRKLLTEYIPVIDTILFPMLFGNNTINHTLETNEYKKYINNKQFRKALLKNVIQLHTDYSGDYALKLEQFYRKSTLIKLSFEKLQSRSWNTACEGIRELSHMKIEEAYPLIRKLIWHKNNTLKLEAFIGIIRLKGVSGLTDFSNYTEPINDWVQLNLLYEINKRHETSQDDFSTILTSKNESLVILGLRLIAACNQRKHIALIRKIIVSGKSYRIKDQAKKTLKKLSVQTLNNLST